MRVLKVISETFDHTNFNWYQNLGNSYAKGVKQVSHTKWFEAVSNYNEFSNFNSPTTTLYWRLHHADDG